ncbi:hypothetical protein QJS66_14750 [Kocuria rhizophila]|nr:hypothetical protein QJS66_14750 [Kocuria rhizophila]
MATVSNISMVSVGAVIGIQSRARLHRRAALLDRRGDRGGHRGHRGHPRWSWTSCCACWATC